MNSITKESFNFRSAVSGFGCPVARVLRCVGVRGLASFFAGDSLYLGQKHCYAMGGKNDTDHAEIVDKFVKKELSLNSITNTLVDREKLLYELLLPEDSL